MQNCVGKSLYERRKPSKLNLILNIIIVVFLLMFVGELIFNSIYTSIYVKGISMNPTLNGAPDNSDLSPGGDYLFVDTHAKPDYSYIVVVKTEDSQGIQYNIIKRVVALGGDTVKMVDGQLSIKKKGKSDFEDIDEPYAYYENPYSKVNNFEEHEVKDGCMFLLGDNRDVSEDSRRKGDFPMSSLVGVVPEWSLKYKSQITAFYTFFEFTLGFGKFSSKIYGN